MPINSTISKPPERDLPPAVRPVASRRWLARWRRPAGAPSGSRPAEVLAVLQQAYAIVEAGWVRNRWYVVKAPTAPASAPACRAVDPAPPEVRACVVGAVALAVRDRNPRADLAVHTGPALAFVWDAVRDEFNPAFFGGATRAAGRAAPRAEHIARMRDLVRWNDEQGRTRADVLAVLDRAAARATEVAVTPARS